MFQAAVGKDLVLVAARSLIWLFQGALVAYAAPGGVGMDIQTSCFVAHEEPDTVHQALWGHDQLNLQKGIIIGNL